jgi:hypothetical protein
MSQGQTHALEGSLVAGGVLIVTGIALLVMNTNTRTTVAQELRPAMGLLTPPAVATDNTALEGVRPALVPSGGVWFRLGGVF